MNALEELDTYKSHILSREPTQIKVDSSQGIKSM